jgi:hypothetical protein
MEERKHKREREREREGGKVACTASNAAEARKRKMAFGALKQ